MGESKAMQGNIHTMPSFKFSTSATLAHQVFFEKGQLAYLPRLPAHHLFDDHVQGWVRFHIQGRNCWQPDLACYSWLPLLLGKQHMDFSFQNDEPLSRANLFNASFLNGRYEKAFHHPGLRTQCFKETHTS